MSEQKTPGLLDLAGMSSGGIACFFRILFLVGGFVSLWFGVTVWNDPEMGGPVGSIDMFFLGIAVIGTTWVANGRKNLARWFAEYWRRNVRGYWGFFHLCRDGELIFRWSLRKNFSQSSGCAACLAQENIYTEFHVPLGGWRTRGCIVASLNLLNRHVLRPSNWRVEKRLRAGAFAVRVTDPEGQARIFGVDQALFLAARYANRDGYSTWADIDRQLFQDIRSLHCLTREREDALHAIATTMEAFDGSTRLPYSTEGNAFRPHLVALLHLFVHRGDPHFNDYAESPKARRERKRQRSRQPAVKQRIVAVDGRPVTESDPAPATP